MVGKDRRLQKLTEGLSAKERAVLVLRAWKEKRAADSAWRLTMPDHQVAEFNSLIRLMNGINFNLGPLLVHLEAQVEMLNLRLGWLATIVMWQFCGEQLADYIRLETKEPVTESEYRKLERKAREEYKPVSDLAERLVERHEDWAEGEIEREEGSHDEVIVAPKAWERVKGEKERELAILVRGRGAPGPGKSEGVAGAGWVVLRPAGVAGSRGARVGKGVRGGAGRGWSGREGTKTVT